MLTKEGRKMFLSDSSTYYATSTITKPGKPISGFPKVVEGLAHGLNREKFQSQHDVS